MPNFYDINSLMQFFSLNTYTSIYGSYVLCAIWTRVMVAPGIIGVELALANSLFDQATGKQAVGSESPRLAGIFAIKP